MKNYGGGKDHLTEFTLLKLNVMQGMRGVILAGGKGTRMAPATLVTNKHLLPIYSAAGAIPMLFYPIHTLVSSGITNILIISSREHCGHIIENLGDGAQFGANFSYKIQDHARVTLGIASALKLAEDFTNDEPFAVILGDNFFEDNFKSEFFSFDSRSDVGAAPVEAAIFVKEVPDPERFGVLADGFIEEKPKVPKSNLAVTGLYLYTPTVYDVAEKLKPSKRGELEITDINNYYCRLGRIDINYIRGFWSDMGTPTSIQNTQEFIQKSGYTLPNNLQVIR